MSLAALVLVLALAASGCGGDKEKSTNTGTASSPETAAATSAPSTTSTPTTGGTDTAGTTAATPPATAPEKQPGGAGDETPASSQALITGHGGKVSPHVIRVPPFIAVKVVLRSADGRDYTLRGGAVRLASTGRGTTATVAGLKAGERLVLRGPQGTVTIEANAEPGP